MKKPITVSAQGKKPIRLSAVPVIPPGVDDKRDCICETLAPHCPVHSVHRLGEPKPGQDCIR